MYLTRRYFTTHFSMPWRRIYNFRHSSCGNCQSFIAIVFILGKCSCASACIACAATHSVVLAMEKMYSEVGVQLFVTRFSKRLRTTLPPQTGQTQSQGLVSWEGCRGFKILEYFFTGAPYYICLSISALALRVLYCLEVASGVPARGGELC